MGYVVFLAVLLLAGAIYATLRIFGVRVTFESMFKALAIFGRRSSDAGDERVTSIDLGDCVALMVLMALYVADVDLSGIPLRYEVIHLCA